MRFYIVILIGSITFLNCSNQNQSDKINQISKSVEKKDSTMIDKYDNWLSKINLDKPKKLYIDILKRAQDSARSLGCEKDFLESLNNESVFQKIINEFKIIPYKDKYLFVRGHNSWTTEGLGNVDNIISLIDKNDNIICFNYDCNGDCAGGCRADSIYLSDWRNNGTPNLMIKKFTRWANAQCFDTEAYDFTSIPNQIFKSFKYNLLLQEKDQYWIYRSKDSIIFERPDLIKVVKKGFDEVIKIKKENYPDKEDYYRRLKIQKESIDTMTPPATYFQFDTVSKKFLEIKR